MEKNKFGVGAFWIMTFAPLTQKVWRRHCPKVSEPRGSAGAESIGIENFWISMILVSTYVEDCISISHEREYSVKQIANLVLMMKRQWEKVGLPSTL